MGERLRAHRRLILVWAVATGVFALFDAAVVTGAALWREARMDAALPALQSASRAVEETARTLPAPWHDMRFDDWFDNPAWAAEYSMPFALGPAALQVLTGATAFGSLLAMALLLAWRADRALAAVAALAIGASVAFTASVLALTTPTIPVSYDWWAQRVGRNSGESTGMPDALTRAFDAADAAVPHFSVPFWWAVAIGVVTALIALAAVVLVLRDPDAVPRPRALWSSILIAALGFLALLAIDSEALSSPNTSVAFLPLTLLLVFLLAAASGREPWWVGVGLSVASVVVHALLYLSYNREGGAPGGWGVGSGYEIGSYATTPSWLVLTVAPVAGWAVAAVLDRVRPVPAEPSATPYS